MLKRFVQDRLENLVRRAVLLKPFIVGDPQRLHVSHGVHMYNALINTASGEVRIGRDVMFGHNVTLLTGTHDIAETGRTRRSAIPWSGRDIVIEEGVWLASNATVLGPCRIGAHAVVAAGAVVTHDVAGYTVVGGVPARVISTIPRHH